MSSSTTPPRVRQDGLRTAAPDVPILFAAEEALAIAGAATAEARAGRSCYRDLLAALRRIRRTLRRAVPPSCPAPQEAP